MWGSVCYTRARGFIKGWHHHQGRMNRLRSSNWLLIGLAAGMIVLALAGVALLVTYLLLARQPAVNDAWINPLAGVKTEAIAPDLAVLTLAGEADDRINRAAIDADETETAYATLANSLLMTDNLRSGGWLLLARQSQEKDPARAAVAYQAALDLASLAPSIGDMGRADLSLQAARGFAALKKDKLRSVGIGAGGKHRSLQRQLAARTAPSTVGAGDRRLSGAGGHRRPPEASGNASTPTQPAPALRSTPDHSCCPHCAAGSFCRRRWSRRWPPGKTRPLIWQPAGFPCREAAATSLLTHWARPYWPRTCPRRILPDCRSVEPCRPFSIDA